MISVKNLKKSFGDLEVLKDINVEIKPQEVVVVIGPSGSGKSTFLRCLNLLETITDGHIYIKEKDLADKQTNINEVRTEVGMVFQQFNLFPHKTVVENVMLAPMKVKGVNKQEAEKNVGFLVIHNMNEQKHSLVRSYRNDTRHK
jgi:glutamine transport system ATP-binding protein